MFINDTELCTLVTQINGIVVKVSVLRPGADDLVHVERKNTKDLQSKQIPQHIQSTPLICYIIYY